MTDRGNNSQFGGSFGRGAGQGGGNKTTVVGVFKSRNDAEKAVNDLEKKGFSKNEISVITKDQGQGGRGGEGGQGGRGGMTMTTGSSYTHQNIGDGVTTGGAIGGLAGLLAGAGALAIPGIGPLLAAGPIAGALTGAVTGGVAGGLIDFGIPPESGRKYEEKVREGEIVCLVKSSSDKVDEAAEIFRRNGATDVETH